MEPLIPQATSSPSQVKPDPAMKLRHFFEHEAISLLRTCRYYAWRGDLAQGHDLDDIAYELFAEVFIQAIEHADHFDTSRQPRLWLQGIAANLVKRKQAEKKYEFPMGDLYATALEDFSEGELFDRISALSRASPEEEVQAKEQAAAILALVSEAERQVLSLAILLDLDSKALGRELGILPSNARVKLHRALNHLRDTWNQQGKQIEGERP